MEDNSICEETEPGKIILYLEKLNLGDNSIFGEMNLEDNYIFGETEPWKIILYLEKLNLEDDSLFGEIKPGRSFYI